MNERSIGGLPWLDYVLATPKQAVGIARAHRQRYEGNSMAYAMYSPLHAAMRRSLNSVDPRTPLDNVVAWAVQKRDWRGPAFRKAANGFLDLLPAGATGVRVAQESWTESELTIVLRDLLGIRLTSGKLLLVAPYCKELELHQDAADILLLMMESVLDQALPGATPVVWDTRHGQAFRLHARTNRRILEVAARGLVAKYLREWSLAA
ncbi:hypothetical protein [Allokutzneria oryzae]|uniref:Uncharacterized protein n=1 Tax=Allokutzneria oryzae TaxID=1378989 RepID=A0ABV6A0Z0_9PSEU